jgi:transcriptional regulator with XRE-family HTH domain
MNDAEMIRFIRNKYDLTQKELASLLNVSLTAVKSWEGRTRSPSGSATRMLKLMSIKPEVVKALAEVEDSRLMINLPVDREKWKSWVYPSLIRMNLMQL